MPTEFSRDGRRFPATRRSVVAAFRGDDSAARRRAWDDLVESYWQPVHGYLRWHWREGAEEARDLTQEFFAGAFDRRTFDRYDPQRARFRTWLRLCLDGFVVNHRKAAGRLKRGGGHEPLSLDAPNAEAELLSAAASAAAGAPGAGDPEAIFHREWVRSLFGLAVADLRRHCAATGRAAQFAVFARYDLDGLDLPAAAGEAGGTVDSVGTAGGAGTGGTVGSVGTVGTGGTVGGVGTGGTAGSRGTGVPGGAESAGAGARREAAAGRPTYGALAAELGLTAVQVTNYLAAARRLLRRLVLRRLRRLTASEAEFRAEARALLGIEIPAAAAVGGTSAEPAGPAGGGGEGDGGRTGGGTDTDGGGR